jgi:hypothetical protein
VIGESRRSLVEQDQPKRAGKTFVPGSPIGILPPVDEIRHVIGDIYEVDVAGTHDLVGNGDAAVAYVTDLIHDPHIVSDHRAAPAIPTRLVDVCRDLPQSKPPEGPSSRLPAR